MSRIGKKPVAIPGGVTAAVNGQEVSNAAEVGRQLQRIASGRIARILVWRSAGEVFVTVKKE